MTCIIGLVADDGTVYMGADSAGVSGYDIRERKDSKIFIKDKMIFGFTSSFRMGQLIRYKMGIPKHFDGVDDYEYMCTSFIDSLIECLKTAGFAKINNNEVTGGVFLVGYRKKIFRIDSDFQVGQRIGNFDSCGCGEDYALGALEVLQNSNCQGYERSIVTKQTIAEEAIIEALTIASKYSAGVSGPFTVLSLPPKKE